MTNIPSLEGGGGKDCRFVGKMKKKGVAGKEMRRSEENRPYGIAYGLMENTCIFHGRRIDKGHAS